MKKYSSICLLLSLFLSFSGITVSADRIVVGKRPVFNKVNSTVEAESSSAEKEPITQEPVIQEPMDQEPAPAPEKEDEKEETATSRGVKSILMAVNQKSFLVDGQAKEMAEPLLIFGKTYVDLYAVAPLLNLITNEANGYHTCSNAVDLRTTTFSHIGWWEDLQTMTTRYFIKDGVVYVSLRELVDLTDYALQYQNGVLLCGTGEIPAAALANVTPYNANDFIYRAYPAWPDHVVRPNQTYTYEKMLSDAEKLAYMHPDLIRLSSIGQSVEGRNLLLVELGRGPYKVFVCGTHHAREYISTTYLMNAIDKYAYAYRNNMLWSGYNPRDILDNITFCIVPMVNPDGVNLVQNGIYATKNAGALSQMGIYEGSKYGYKAWKANVRGVDVNWNYDKDWSSKKNKNERGSTGFNGDRPGTEPETLAVSRYVDSHNFEAFLSFHTQGEIFYWADSRSNPIGLQKAIERDTGFAGHQESGTGVGGSFFDYVYRKFDKPTITVELCPYVGNYPYPDNDFNTIWWPAKNILMVVGNEILYAKSH